jgi:hypothetical protein
MGMPHTGDGHMSRPDWLNELIRTARDQGWAVHDTGRGHIKFLPKDQKFKPIHTGSTPSDAKVKANLESQLTKAGLVLPKTEKNPENRGNEKPGPTPSDIYDGSRDPGEVKVYFGGEGNVKYFYFSRRKLEDEGTLKRFREAGFLVTPPLQPNEHGRPPARMFVYPAVIKHETHKQVEARIAGLLKERGERVQFLGNVSKLANAQVISPPSIPPAQGNVWRKLADALYLLLENITKFGVVPKRLLMGRVQKLGALLKRAKVGDLKETDFDKYLR